MAALVEAARAPDYPAQIVLVLSNKAEAAGLGFAEDAGIDTAIVSHRGFRDREAYDRLVHERLLAAGAEFVCLAGFMRMLSPWFCQQWAGRMINVHPSLLPSFRGLDTHARALAEGVKLHGASVHFVVPELDAGPIIAQAAVPVLDDDTEQTLAARVLAQEHVIYPLALKLAASGALRIEGNRVLGGVSAVSSAHPSSPRD